MGGENHYVADDIPVSRFHVPGAYRFDASPPETSPVFGAAVFRAPLLSPSPPSSTYDLAASIDTLYSTATPVPTAKRKRTKIDIDREASPPAEWPYLGTSIKDASTPGLRKYTLAGQIETPGAARSEADDGLLSASIYSDVNYRRSLGPTRGFPKAEASPERLAGTRGHELRREAADSPGWSSAALQTIGGVVGKVWNFCTAGAFRGFQAGGGAGFDGDQNPTTAAESKENRPDKTSPPNYLPHQASAAPLTTSQANNRGSTPRPSIKRRQTTKTDELRNWVVVEHEKHSKDELFQHRPHRRTDSGASIASLRGSAEPEPLRYISPTTSSGRRISVPVSRMSSSKTKTPLASHTRSISQAASQSPVLVTKAATRGVASYAPPRLPTTSRDPARLSMAGGSRPSSRQSSTAFPTNRLHPYAASPSSPRASGHRRNISGASAVSTASATRRTKLDKSAHPSVAGADRIIDDSPRLDAEAKKLAAHRKAERRRADAQIDDFSFRLQEMIRQGKEALGSTVEVEYEMEIEAWPGDE
jgi:hypothetical protein